MSAWQIDKENFICFCPWKQLYENSIRAKAFAIVHSCISMLGSMSGVYKVDYPFDPFVYYWVLFAVLHIVGTDEIFDAERYSYFDDFGAWSTNRAILHNSKFPGAVRKSWWLEHADGGIYIIEPMLWLNASSLIFNSDSYVCLLLRCWNVYFSLSRTFLDCPKLKFLASIDAEYFFKH